MQQTDQAVSKCIYITIVKSSQVIHYFKKCGFCAVVRSTYWLEGAEEFVWNKVIV